MAPSPGRDKVGRRAVSGTRGYSGCLDWQYRKKKLSCGCCVVVVVNAVSLSFFLSLSLSLIPVCVAWLDEVIMMMIMSVAPFYKMYFYISLSFFCYCVVSY